MTTIDAELKRRAPDNSIVNWLLDDDIENTTSGFSDPVIDFGARSRLAQINAKMPDESGTWGYHAGISGTVVCAAGERVIGIAAMATTAATVSINGGDSIPVLNAGLSLAPKANLVAPTIVFSGTTAYVVEVVT